MNNSPNLEKILYQNIAAVGPSPILTWKSKKIEGALITKIGEQRYLGLACKDRKGQEYWRYHRLTSEQSSPNPPPSPPPPSENQVPAQSGGESEPVKNFREKYGTSSNPKEPVQ